MKIRLTGSIIGLKHEEGHGFLHPVPESIEVTLKISRCGYPQAKDFMHEEKPYYEEAVAMYQSFNLLRLGEAELTQEVPRVEKEESCQ